MLQLFDMRETGGLELTSTVTLVLQANRLTFLVNIVEGSELTSFIYRRFEQKSIKQEDPLLKTGVSGHSFHCFLLSGKKKTGGE